MKDYASLTTISYPSQYANRIHVFNMCLSFQKMGVETCLYCNSYDGADTKFKIREVKSSKLLVIAWKLAKMVPETQQFAYCREPRLFFCFFVFRTLLLRRHPMYIFEILDIHEVLIDKWTTVFAVNIAHLVIAITPPLGKYVKTLQYKKSNIIVSPDGVNIDQVNKAIPKDLYTSIGISNMNPVALYSGSLQKWKGVDTILGAAELAPDINFVIVGGKEDEIAFLKKTSPKNIFFTGYVKSEEVFSYTKSANILLLPNKKTLEVSVFYTSPLKLFEYMATGKPIVFSNLPAMREILQDGINGFAFESEDNIDLVKVIREVLKDTQVAKKIASRSLEQSRDYSWDNRVKSIISKVNQIS